MVNRFIPQRRVDRAPVETPVEIPVTMPFMPPTPPPGTFAAVAAGREPDRTPPPALAPVAAPFTRQDAENILVIIKRAPLQGLDEADELRGILQRFATFVVANVP